MKSVGGNDGKYRSDVNFGNGLRLLSSRLSLNSRADGHGHFFDELMVLTQGLGNDPYESASLRIAKNRNGTATTCYGVRTNTTIRHCRFRRGAPGGHNPANPGPRHHVVPPVEWFFAGFSRVTETGRGFSHDKTSLMCVATSSRSSAMCIAGRMSFVSGTNSACSV